MHHTETVEIGGHIMDSGVLARVLDDVLEYGGDYTIARLDLGKRHHDESYARIEVGSGDTGDLQRLLMRLQIHGVNLVDPGVATLRPAELNGVFPEDFYSTTNLETQVRVGGHWLPVEQPEMDCGLLVTAAGLEAAGQRAPEQGDLKQGGAKPRITIRTVPVSDVRAGDQIVCGASGVRVILPAPAGDGDQDSFGFMSSDVSSEKPQALQVRRIAEQLREVKAAGRRILWVGGPAIVHTGAAPAMTALVRAGFVDLLYAGNALATHDIEAALYGTSLGMDLAKGRGVPHGHEHHIRAINTIRRCGSIGAAVKDGVLTSGVMHALVECGRDFVLVGSVRDDGPLPDVHTDVIAGQRAMRAGLAGVGFCIVVGTMLHGIATGNILPASIPLVCVDINPATVTKLADRGSAQAIGIVTDIGLFFEQLARELAPGYQSPEG